MKTTNYRRLHGVVINSVTRKDAGGWVGIITESHGEIRAKADLKTRMKLKKGWKGSLTVGNYGNATVLAFDQRAHLDVKSHWNILDPKRFNEEHFGFIYCITNKTNNRKYIGLKFFHAGAWKDYTGSSKDLNEDIKALGKENFTFDIWYSCEARGDVVYREVKEQHDHNVLTARLPNGDRAYYNKFIAAIKFIPPCKPPFNEE